VQAWTLGCSGGGSQCLLPWRNGTADDGDRDGDRQKIEGALALALAWIGGSVDAIGYLTLSQLFTAHMSGNSAALGAYFGTGQWRDALHRLTPVPPFVLGVIVGDAVIEVAMRRGGRAAFSIAATLEMALLLGFRVLGGPSIRDGAFVAGATWRYGLLVALLSVAMGVQTAALRRAGSSTVHTTYITGMLTSVAKEMVAALFALRDGNREPASASVGVLPKRFSPARLLMGGIWVAFVLGAIAGGFVTAQGEANAVLLPAVALIALIAGAMHRASYPRRT
jgi:uncharacterized membrane protein YoaK (UPF0700 family)